MPKGRCSQTLVSRPSASRLHIILRGCVTKNRICIGRLSGRHPRTSDMTNPGTTSPLEIDTWPLRTVRCAGALIIVSSLINLGNLVLVTHASAFPALVYTIFDLAVGCALVTFTFTIIFRKHWQSITWIGSVLIIASD